MTLQHNTAQQINWQINWLNNTDNVADNSIHISSLAKLKINKWMLGGGQ